MLFRFKPKEGALDIFSSGELAVSADRFHHISGPRRRAVKVVVESNPLLTINYKLRPAMAAYCVWKTEWTCVSMTLFFVKNHRSLQKFTDLFQLQFWMNSRMCYPLMTFNRSITISWQNSSTSCAENKMKFEFKNWKTDLHQKFRELSLFSSSASYIPNWTYLNQTIVNKFW